MEPDGAITTTVVCRGLVGDVEFPAERLDPSVPAEVRAPPESEVALEAPAGPAVVASSVNAGPSRPGAEQAEVRPNTSAMKAISVAMIGRERCDER